MLHRTPPAPHRVAPTAPRLLVAVALLALGAASCGVGPILRRGDAAAAAGRYDEAIRAYDDAARQAGATTAEGRLAEQKATQLRRQAAHEAVARGDAAFEAHALASAAEHYRRARAFAPADPRVVAALSRLLALRTDIETGVREVETALQGLSSAGDEADLELYRRIAGRARTLRTWRADYPQTEALWDRARRGIARRLIAEARLVRERAGAGAAAPLAEEALRWDGEAPGGVELRDALRAAGDADARAADGQAALERGDLDKALRGFDDALRERPDHPLALRGRAQARDAWVRAHLDAAKSAARARKRRDALLLLRQAAEVGADDAKLQKQLDKTLNAAVGAAVRTFVGRAKALSRKHWDGAALVALRTAAAIGGGEGVGGKLEAAARSVDDGRRYSVAIDTPAVPKEQRKTLAPVLVAALGRRIGDAELGAAGVVWVEGREAKRADGRLKLDVARWDVIRMQRREERRKKVLDHVEFPPNPAWRQAQSEQASALASLNAATDALRPLQQRAEDAETRLAEVDGKLAEIRARIDAENAEHYRGKPAPCADGTTRCPESYGHKRWAKQLDYYGDKSRALTDELRRVSPDLDAARARVATAQRAFDAAERKARETPAKLREEVWKDHLYEVLVHEVRIDLDLGMAWYDRTTGKELARGVFRYEDVRLDYETPEIVVKEQLVEAARKSELPDDAALEQELLGRALDAVCAKVWPPISAHGQRFVLRAEAASKPDERLHWAVMALSVGRGLDDRERAKLEQMVYETTGYDWQKIAVDLSRIPY
ncbi:MAG: hypothetical protein H6747_02895 [Deltaproteobacteria bacterium]|nr:hypothetical protein [Deltaproteobacteria bacterium]